MGSDKEINYHWSQRIRSNQSCENVTVHSTHSSTERCTNDINIFNITPFPQGGLSWQRIPREHNQRTNFKLRNWETLQTSKPTKVDTNQAETKISNDFQKWVWCLLLGAKSALLPSVRREVQKQSNKQRKAVRRKCEWKECSVGHGNLLPRENWRQIFAQRIRFETTWF
jgi:hypothetical protein